MAEKRVVELEVKTTGAENSEKSVKSLKARLRELKLELQGLDEGSDQFKKLVREAGELQDTIGDLNQQVKNFASDTRRLDATLEGIGAVAGAFGAVESSLALVGVESEELQKTMVRLQAAMTLVNSVQSVANVLQKESAFMTSLSAVRTNLLTKATVQQAVATGTATTAQKIMNFVMKQNPIFLIIGAVTALVGAFAWLSSKTENLTETNDKLNASYEKSQKLADDNYEKTLQRRNNNIAILESENADIKDIFNERLKAIEDAEKKQQEDLEKALKKRQETSRIYQKTKDEELKKTLQEQSTKEVETINKLRALEENFATQRILLVNEYNNIQAEKQKEANQKRIDKQKEANDKYREAEKRFRDQLKSDILANEQEQIDKDKAHKDKLLAQQEAYAEAVQEARGLNIESALSDEEIEIRAIELKYAKIQELGDLNKDLEEARLNELNEIRTKYAKEASDNKDAQDKLDLENEKKLQDLKIQAVVQGLTLISDFTEAFNKSGLISAKKAFQIQKAVSIASATIATYQSAVSAYQSQFLPIPDPSSPIRGGIAAGIAIAAGLGNIAKISAQKFEGGGSPAGAGGGGAPTTQVTTPNFNIVGQSGANTLGMQTQPLQAYVVSGEVTSQQALDRNRLKNATFG